MFKNDLVRLRHMLDAAREAVELAAGKSKGDIEKERLLNLSLVRLIEVFGEVANRVSPEGRDKYPSIPWQQIIGMRNRLIHGYDDIDFEMLYRTIAKDLPPLISQLGKIVPGENQR